MEYKLPEQIAQVADQITALCAPEMIYLYNQRITSSGHTSGFKLCVILDTGDKEAVERSIYLTIDSEVPFDVLLYTPGEWAEQTGRPDSFASKILQTGLVVYG